MIAFGVAVTRQELFERVAVPGIRRVAGPDAEVITRHRQPIAIAYNGILDQAAEIPDLEALVLVHQDAELLDEKLEVRIRARFSDPSVAVIGTVGVRNARSGLMWTRGGENIGLYRGELYGAERFFASAHQLPQEVEAVDGFLMVLAPWAVTNLRFDEAVASNFHCYDTDFCFQARARGKRVVVEPIDAVHRWTPRLPGSDFRRALESFHRKWGVKVPTAEHPVAHSLWGGPADYGHVDDDGVQAGGWTSHTVQALLAGRDRRVLELGCHVGRMSATLRDQGCAVTGVELDPAAAEEARAICDRVVEADLDRFDPSEALPNESFDVIVAGDVLEHLKDPTRLVADLMPLLSDRGYMVASLPNVAHGSVRLALLQGRFAPQPSGLLDRTHLRFFTKQTGAAMLEAAGYRVAWIEAVKARILPAPLEALKGASAGDPRPRVDWSRVPTDVLVDLYSDPEADDFQYVFAAFPRHRPEPPDLRAAIMELRRHRARYDGRQRNGCA